MSKFVTPTTPAPEEWYALGAASVVGLVFSGLSKLSIFATVGNEQNALLNELGIYNVMPIWLSMDNVFSIITVTYKIAISIYGMYYFGDALFNSNTGDSSPEYIVDGILMFFVFPFAWLVYCI